MGFMPTIVLGLGSNLGDRAQHLRQAVKLLSRRISGVRLSSVYESKAVLPRGASDAWDIPYYNMALRAEVSMSPEELLTLAKDVEKKLGRSKRERWAPREIDIDILAYGEKTYDADGLIIPHPYLLERDFALLPLVELWPDWKYPIEGIYKNKPARALVKTLGFKERAELRKLKVQLHAA